MSLFIYEWLYWYKTKYFSVLIGSVSLIYYSLQAERYDLCYDKVRSWPGISFTIWNKKKKITVHSFRLLVQKDQFNVIILLNIYG